MLIGADVAFSPMWVTTTGFKGSYRCAVGNRPGGAVIMTNVEHPDATVRDSVELSVSARCGTSSEQDRSREDKA